MKRSIVAGLLLSVFVGNAWASDVQKTVAALESIENVARIALQLCNSKIKIANLKNTLSKSSPSAGQRQNIDATKDECSKEASDRAFEGVMEMRDQLNGGALSAAKSWFSKYREMLDGIDGKTDDDAINFHELDKAMKRVEEELVF